VVILHTEVERVVDDMICCDFMMIHEENATEQKPQILNLAPTHQKRKVLHFMNKTSGSYCKHGEDSGGSKIMR